MRKMLIAIPALLFVIGSTAQKTESVDICIYGATSAGVIAAYTAKKLHHSVLLIDPGKHIGGLTSGGLGFTDIGNKYAVSGLGLDFYRRAGRHYGKQESWIFEPHVASEIFHQYLRSASIDVVQEWLLTKVKKEKGYIRELEFVHASGGKKMVKKVRAKMFIDCTYEGDLLAMAGVSYTTGREANSIYNETWNGVQLRDKHQFPDGIDPYKVPGDLSSGLLWGISPETLAPPGSGDKKIQAYNFRVCLTEDPANRIGITRPAGYDSTKYELLLRLLAKKPAEHLNAFLKVDRMPNHKTDINNNGAFSTDMIGMNYAYPEGNAAERKVILQELELYTKGLLYFIGHDLRMPAHLRNEMLQWGYPKDEFTGNGHFTPQPYVREARRMIGAYVMTQANCEGRETVTDGVGMAAYTMDSHNCERIVVNGMVKNEGDVQVGGFGPYPVSYRAIIPKATECKNLLVPVCLSASHIAYGSIRMEPVFMVLAQAAATAATVAVNDGVAVQEVDVKTVQRILKTNPLADGSTPEIIVDNADSAQVYIQGNWTVKLRTGFGPSALVAEGKTTTERSVTFTPHIQQAGYYNVFLYYSPGYNQLAEQTRVTITNGSKTIMAPVIKSAVRVQGQTSGEWILLGRFLLPAGNKSKVTVHADNNGAAVVADAVLFQPDFKNP